ncbi:MAG: RedB protein [Candidatus Sumerlaeaceae bacterium]
MILKLPIHIIIIAVLWFGSLCVGSYAMLSYEFGAKEASAPAGNWPHDTAYFRNPHKPTLLTFLHPRCPCSKATLGELALLVAASGERLDTRVIFVEPEGIIEDWPNNNLRQAASEIPGVTITFDHLGAQAQKFHASVSGETFFYDPEGSLLFSGGITGSRGHSGANPGRTAITSLVHNENPEVRTSKSFGCQLFHTQSACCQTSCPLQ